MSFGPEKQKNREIVDGLISPYWFERAQAMKSIEAISTASQLRGIYLLVEQSHDDTLRLTLIESINPFLKKKDIELVSESLLILILESEKSNPKVKNLAKLSLHSFLESENIVRYLKILGLRHCISNLPLNKRAYVTNLIGEFKIVELVPIILQNFNSTDDSLKRSTIEVLIKLEDGRGNRFFKSILKEKNEENYELAIKAIGKLGNIFDVYGIFQFLKHRTPRIRLNAIVAISKLLGYYALVPLFRHYLNEKNTHVKREIVYQLGKLPYRLSAKILIRLYASESDFNILQQVEWALQQMPRRVLMPVVSRNFDRQNETTKFKLLRIVGEMNDPRGIKIIKRILSDARNEFILIEAFDVSTLYNSEELLFEIKKYLYSDSSNLRYYSLLTCLKHTCFNRLALFEEFIENESISDHFSLLLIRFAAEHAALIRMHHDLVVKTRNYFKRMMQSSSFESKIASIENVWKFSDEEVFKLAYHHLAFEKSNLIKKAYLKSTIRILASNPEFINLQPEIFNNPVVVDAINPELVELKFWNSFLSTHIQYGEKWFELFWERKSIQIGKALMIWVEQNRELELIASAISMIRKSQVDFTDQFLDYLIQDVYVWGNERIKYEVLMFVATCSRIEDFDFLWFESQIKGLFPQQGKRLLSQYMAGVE